MASRVWTLRRSGCHWVVPCLLGLVERGECLSSSCFWNVDVMMERHVESVKTESVLDEEDGRSMAKRWCGAWVLITYNGESAKMMHRLSQKLRRQYRLVDSKSDTTITLLTQCVGIFSEHLYPACLPQSRHN